MAHKTVAAVIGRAAASKKFLEELKTNPDKALSEYKNDLSDDEIKSIKNMKKTELDQLNQAVAGTDIAAMIDKNI